MTNLTVSARFTKNGSQPATGLTLSDISLFLTQQNKSTGVDTVVWNGTQNPTVEVDNVGVYTRILATADLKTYDYFAMAQYIGAVVLDTNYAYGQASMVEADVIQNSMGGAIAPVDFTYTVRNSRTNTPIEGVQVWFYTEAAATNLIWYGVTDAFGVARDSHYNLPRLDPGT